MPEMSRLVLACVVALSSLTGCTGATPNAAPGPAGGAATAAPSSGPAPTATNSDRSIRIDGVRRAGTAVALDLTLGTAQGPWASSFGPSSFEIKGNDGLSIDTKGLDERSVPVNSLVRASVAVQLPAATATALTLKWGDLPVTVDLPADGASVWQPAALRQTGLPEPLLFNDGLGLAVDTIRSEGLITEVAFHGWGRVESITAAPCSYNFTWRDCRLVEPDGTVHPLVGSTATTSHPEFGRMSGVIRFLGEIKPESESLQLFLSANAVFDPVALNLPPHAGSPAQAAAGSLSRPPITLDPARRLRHKGSGALLTFDRIGVLEDRVQLHLKAKGGSARSANLLLGIPDSKLTEPSGAVHPLVKPAAGTIELKRKGSLDAILVYQGAVAAKSTSLELTLGLGIGAKPVITTFAIPPVDPNPPAAEATLGDIGAAEPPLAASPELAASPAPSSAAVTAFTITPASSSIATELGPIRSWINGVSSGDDTGEDPGEAEKADRTLEEMGAQRTPDGWVLTLPETVLFDYNSAELKGDARATLTKVAALLNHFAKAKIGVNGHTDNSGASDHNKDLSNRRAGAVAEALASVGVARDRMTVAGFGETRPVASNANDAGKQKNRRVEIVLRQAS